MNERINNWLWKRSSCLNRGPLGEHGGDAPFLGLPDKDEILYYQETLFIGGPERYVKEALERGNSLSRGPVMEPGWGSLTGDFERK